MKLKLHCLRNLGATALLATSLLLGLSPAQADTLTWGGSAGTWDTSTQNWTNSAGSPAIWSDVSTSGTDTAIFAGTAGAVTLNTNLSALGLVFSTTNYGLAGTGTLTLGTGGVDASAITSGTISISSKLSLAGGQTWTVGSGGTLSASGVISGANSLTKSGAGTLTLSGANTYSGGTTLNAGTLIFSNATALGSGTATLNGGTLKFGGGVTIGNSIVVSAAATLDQGGQNGGVSGNISGSGALTLNGTLATTTLSGNNALFTGTFTQGSSNAISITSANAGSASAGWVFNDATADRVRVNITGTNTLNFGSLSGNGQIQNDTASSLVTLSVGNLNTSTTFGGTIKEGAAGKALALTKIGTGGLTLTGASVYSGTTTISSGTLQIGANGTTGSLSSSSAILDNATLSFNRSNTLVQGTDFSSSAITGSGGIAQDGSGKTTLNVANTFTGATTLNSGTLSVADTSYLGGASADNGITFNGGTLQITGATMTSFGSHTPTFNATKTVGLDINNAANTFTVSQNLNQTTGGLTKLGAGALTLSGLNGYTGTTTVNAGTLNYTGTLSSGGQILVGVSGAGNAMLNVQSGASLNVNNTTVLIGAGTTPSSGAGFVYQTGGNFQGGAQAAGGSGFSGLRIGGNGQGSYGYYNMSGGTLNFSELDVASGDSSFNGVSNGLMDISGGTVTTGSNAGNGWLIVNRGLGSGDIGVLNLTGGSLTFTGPSTQFQNNWGTNGTAIINIANATLSATNANIQLNQKNSSTNFGEINLLSGGLLQANSISNNTATNLVNFNGGTFKASNATTTFLNNLTATVYSGGGTIDNNNVAITIPAGLLAASGSGVSTVALTNTGSGYQGAPIVTFSGGGGTGAAGYAVISSGTISSIVITNPGTGYTSAPTITLTGGGATVSGTIGTISLNTGNTSGGMTFQGNNTTTLTGISTYTGATTISSGNLTIGSAGQLGGGNYAGNISNSGTFTYNSTAAQTLSGTISGAGALTKSAASTLTLSASNSYTGATTISTGTLQLGNANAVANSTVTNSVANGLGFSSSIGTFNLGGLAGASNDSLIDASGSGVTLSVGGNNATTTYSGILSGTTGSSLTKVGTGTLVLGGVNTYSGGTTINSGTLQLTQTAGATATGTLTLGGGALQLNQGGNNFAYAPTLNLTADSTFSNIGAGAINLTGSLVGNNHALTVNNTGNRVYYNGNASGITQFNVTAGALGFDLGGGNVGGGAPVNVSNGASLWFVNQTITAPNNITLNGGTGYNGTGALYQESSATVSKLSGTVTLNSGTSSIGVANGGGTIWLSGKVTGSGGFSKLGSGILRLTGTNDFSGDISINAGTVAFSNTSGTNSNLGSGSVTVNTGGILRPGYSTTNTFISTSTNNITLAGGAIYADDAHQHLNGTLNVSTSGTLGSTYNAGSNLASEGDKGLAIDGLVTGSGPLTVQQSRFDTGHNYSTGFVSFSNNSNTYSGTITVNENTTSTEGNVYLGINGSTALQNAAVTTGTFTSTNRNFGNSVIVFNSGLGSATIGSISGSGPLILNGYNESTHVLGTDAIALTVGGNNADTTYSAVISGSGSLTKAGTGTMTLSGANTYSGATNVNNGTLNVNGVNSGTGLVTVGSGATLAGSGTIAGATVVSGALSGNLTLNNDATIGIGATAAASAFNGNVVNNGTITSSLNLQSGKTLSGTGTTAAVTAVSSATVAPGNAGAGILTVATGNDFSLNSGAHLAMELGGSTAGTTHDQVLVQNGTVNLNADSGAGATLDLTLSYVPTAGDTLYLILNGGAGAISGTFNGLAEGSTVNLVSSVDSNTYAFTLTYQAIGNGDSIANDVALMAVPEPSTWAMMLSGLGLLSFWQRSRRKSA